VTKLLPLIDNKCLRMSDKTQQVCGIVDQSDDNSFGENISAAFEIGLFTVIKNPRKHAGLKLTNTTATAVILLTFNFC
jgi:hypothetical protein